MSSWQFSAGMPTVLASVVMIAAFLRGAAPERILATTLVLESGFELLWWAVFPTGSDWQDASFDLLMFVPIVAVALHANRLYPVWVGGGQIVKLIAHGWRLSLAKLPLEAHFLIDRAVFDMQLAAVAIGVTSHILRLRRRQLTPPWYARKRPPAR